MVRVTCARELHRGPRLAVQHRAREQRARADRQGEAKRQLTAGVRELRAALGLDGGLRTGLGDVRGTGRRVNALDRRGAR